MFVFGICAYRPDNHQRSDRKFLVFEDQLLALFQTCSICTWMSTAEIACILGTLVKIKQQCTNCGYVRTWSSQPCIRQMPVGNLQLSAAILLSGSLPSQALRMLHFLGVASISRNTFNQQQSNYIWPTIINKWREDQEELIAVLASEEGGHILSGDGRNDSPGYCAKYGSYAVIEQRINKVLDLQLVQV